MAKSLALGVRASGALGSRSTGSGLHIVTESLALSSVTDSAGLGRSAVSFVEVVAKSSALYHTTAGASFSSGASSVGPGVLVSTEGTVTECDVVNHVTGACFLSVTVHVDSADTVGLGGERCAHSCLVLTVEVVVNNYEILLCIESDHEREVHPTGVVVLVEIYGSECNTVEASELNLAVRRSGHSEEGIVDVPLSGPSACIGAEVYKLPLTVVVHVSVEIKGEETNVVSVSSEALKALAAGTGKPDLNLLSIGGLCLEVLEVLVAVSAFYKCGICAVTIEVCAACAGEVLPYVVRRIVTVGESTGLYGVAKHAVLAEVLNGTVVYESGVVVLESLAGGEATGLTSSGSCAGRLSHIVRKNVAYPTTSTGCGSGARGSLSNNVLNIVVKGPVTERSVADVEIIEYNAGALTLSPTTDVERLDKVVNKTHAIVLCVEVLGEGATEGIVEIVVNGHGLRGGNSNDHLNVKPLISCNSSKSGRGHRVTVYLVSAVIVRLNCKNVNRVVAPTYPIGIRVSCLHKNESYGTGLYKLAVLIIVVLSISLNFEGNYAESVSFAGKSAHSIISIGGGDVKHVLRTNLRVSGNYILAINNVETDVTGSTLAPVPSLVCTVVYVGSIASVGSVAACANYGYLTIGSNGREGVTGCGENLVNKGLATGVTYYLLGTCGKAGSVNGSGLFVVTESCNFVAGVGVATITSEGGEACLGTSGSGNALSVAVLVIIYGSAITEYEVVEHVAGAYLGMVRSDVKVVDSAVNESVKCRVSSTNVLAVEVVLNETDVLTLLVYGKLDGDSNVDPTGITVLALFKRCESVATPTGNVDLAISGCGVEGKEGDGVSVPTEAGCYSLGNDNSKVTGGVEVRIDLELKYAVSACCCAEVREVSVTRRRCCITVVKLNLTKTGVTFLSCEYKIAVLGNIRSTVSDRGEACGIVGCNRSKERCVGAGSVVTLVDGVALAALVCARNYNAFALYFVEHVVSNNGKNLVNESLAAVVTYYLVGTCGKAGRVNLGSSGVGVLALFNEENLKLSDDKLTLEVVEVEEHVGDCKSLGEGVGHGVPLTVEDEISTGKLGIVVTCERMVAGSLNLNVSVSLEEVTLKVLEGIAAVSGALVLVYSTFYLVYEGEAGSRLGAINVYSELGELLALVAYPRSSLGEVYAGNLSAVHVSLNEYGSTLVAVVCRGLIPLLDLVGNYGLKNGAGNVFLSNLFSVEGSLRLNVEVHLKVSYDKLTLEVIEVEEHVGDCKSLGEGVGHGVPLTVEDEISTGKLGIVVTCERMVAGSLNLNVSVSLEEVTLKVLEGIAAVSGALVLVYSTFYLVYEGEAGSRLGAINVYSELGELLALVAYPRSSLGEVYAGNLSAVHISLNEYGSTVVAVVSLGLVPLLDLVGNYGLKNRAGNGFLSNLLSVEGLFHDGCVVEATYGVTEVEVRKDVTVALGVGSTVNVERADVVGPDNHVSLYVSEVLAVDVVVKRYGVIRLKLYLDNNVHLAGPTVGTGHSPVAESCAVVTGDLNGSIGILVRHNLEYAYGAFRPTVVGRTTPVGSVTVSVNLELDTGVVVILGVNSEGKETGCVVSAGEACKIGRYGLTGYPELMLSVSVGTVVEHGKSLTVIGLVVETCSGSVGDVAHVVHTTVESVVLVTILTGVLYVTVNVNCNEAVVSESLALGYATALTGCGSTTGSLGEVVCGDVAFPATRAGRLVSAGSAIGYVVNVTVKSVVTLYGVTEVEVIKDDTGVSRIGPTGDLKSLDLLRIESSVRTGVVEVSGVRAYELAVDVVVNGEVTVIGHLNNHHNVEPLGPAVLAGGNNTEVDVSAVETALEGRAISKSIFDSEYVDRVIVPRTAIIPVSSISGLTNGEGESGIPIGMTGKARLNVEGDNAYCIVLAGEVLEGAFTTVVRRHPHLELTACIALIGIFIPTVCLLSTCSGEVRSNIGSGLEEVLILALVVYVKSNVTVGNVLKRRIGAVAVPIAELLDSVACATLTAVGENAVSNSGGEVVLVSSVTERDVIDLVTGACCLVVRIDVNALNSVGVSGKRSCGSTCIRTVYIIGSDYLIRNGIKNELDSNVYPTGVVVLVNVYGSKKKAVEANKLCLTVRGRKNSEYRIVDCPRIRPTDALSSTVAVEVEVVNSVVNKLHLKVVVGVSVDAEGKVTGRVRSCGEAGELIGAGARSGKPNLKLLLSACLYVISNVLVVTAVKNRVVSLIGIRGVVLTVVGSVNTHTVVVSTVHEVAYFSLEGVATSGAGVGSKRTVSSYGKISVKCLIGLTAGLATKGTGRGRSTVCACPIMLESSALSSLGIGCIATDTLSGLSTVKLALSVVVVLIVNELVAESLTGGESTYGTSSSLVTGSRTVVVSGCCEFLVGGVVTLVTGLVCFPTLFGTGRSLSCVIYELVTKSLTLGDATCGTGLGSGTVSVCPSVLMIVEYPLRIVSITECEVVEDPAGASLGPTANVYTLDHEILNGLSIACVKKVSGVNVAEYAVYIVRDVEHTVRGKLHEHLNVNPLVTAYGSEFVGGNVHTVNGVSTVTVRLNLKKVHRVAVPTTVSIPVGIVSCGHNDEADSIGNVASLELEGNNTYRVLSAGEVFEDICVTTAVRGEVEHVLGLLSTSLNNVLAVGYGDGRIAVLREHRKLSSVIYESLVSNKVLGTGCTSVDENLVNVRSGYGVLFERLTLGLTTAIQTG